MQSTVFHRIKRSEPGLLLVSVRGLFIAVASLVSNLSHGSPANLSGKYYNVVSYDVNHETGLIDYDEIRDMAKQCRPKMIIAGASAYPRAIDFKIFSDIAHEVGAIFMVDMAHIAGLVAGGAHMNPVPYADIVTTTTHKTLRGPRGGLILAREEFAKKLNSGVFPGTQGGPLEHVIAAKAVCLKEAMQPEFKDYAHIILKSNILYGDDKNLCSPIP